MRHVKYTRAQISVRGSEEYDGTQVVLIAAVVLQTDSQKALSSLSDYE